MPKYNVEISIFSAESDSERSLRSNITDLLSGVGELEVECIEEVVPDEDDDE
jgi:hypothetical protein